MRSFCVVAEEMHVTRAAARLHIAQPALTQQIRALEKEIGYALVRRDGRGIELTEAGVVFRKEAQLILDQVRGVLLRTREAGRGSVGQITVGIAELASCSPVVTSICATFRQEWPGVVVSYVQERTLEMLQGLMDGRIDVVLGCPSIADHPKVEWATLASDRAMVAMPKGHPLARRSFIPLKALEDVPMVLVTQGGSHHSFATALDVACREYDFAPRIVQECPELLLALNLVAAGVGVSFVPEYLKAFRPDAIAYIPLRTSPPPGSKVLLATRPDDPSVLVGNFKAIAKRDSPNS